MLLFKKPFWEGLTTGAIRLTFRRWQQPHVRAGGRYRCHPIGVLEVDDIRRVRVRDITEADATRAGFPSRDALLAYLAELGPLDETTDLYRIELHHGGDGDRVELALETSLSAQEVAAITARLARLDRDRAWTREALSIIAHHPRIAASRLAAALGRETQPFKIEVRKLKRLGLTQSFEVGYEISPRGRAYVEATGMRLAAKRTMPTKPTRTKQRTKKTEMHTQQEDKVRPGGTKPSERTRGRPRPGEGIDKSTQAVVRSRSR